MKRLNKRIISILVALIGLCAISCQKKGCTDEKAANYDSDAKKDDGKCKYDNIFEGCLENGATLPSEIVEGSTLLLCANNSYILSGAITVKDGGILKVEEGVTVIAKGASPSSMYIAVEKGGKIEAIGTDALPIVFTAEDENPSAWGGISIAGKATCNTGINQEAEIAGLLYGGSTDNDNSGTLRYVRVEYSGAQINATKQFNGFSFYGVGSGTTIEYIESYKGGDDGIEFFGGTVDISYAVSIGSGDDSFDFAEGWNGTANYLYIEHLSGLVQDKGIEGDNLKSNNAATPISNPTIKNVTIRSLPGIRNIDDEKVDGIRIREGTKGVFSNIIIDGFEDDGIDARSLATLQNINSGSLVFEDIAILDIGDKNVDAKFDIGEPFSSIIISDAIANINSGIVSTTTGAEFDTWKGTWTK